MKDTSENYLLSESDPLVSKQLFHVALAPGVERLGHHCEFADPVFGLDPGDKGLEQQTARQFAVLVAGGPVVVFYATGSAVSGGWRMAERGQSQFDWKASARIKGFCWQEGFPETLKGGEGSKNFSY